MTRKRLDELLARLQPKLAKRFRQVMQRVRDKRTLAELESALESGTIATVLDDIDQATAVLASQSAAAHAFIAAEVAEELSTKLDKLISYDGTNPRAVAVLARRRLELSTELVETQRQAIGETLRLGLENGLNPRQTAVAIRDSIGLTVPQTQWVANYRRKLENASRGALDNALRDARSDRAVARAAATGTPLPQARIDKLVERYAERQLNYRAEVIAREETLRSLEAAQDEAFQQVIDAGQLDADRVQLEWHQRSRPNMRDIHRPMDGQLRRFGEAFVSGAGNLLRFPHDPDAPLSELLGCGCYVTRRVLPVGRVAVSGEARAA